MVCHSVSSWFACRSLLHQLWRENSEICRRLASRIPGPRRAMLAMSYGPVSDRAHFRAEPYAVGASLGLSAACQFFVKTGWCKWGDGCRHAHIPGPDTPNGGRPAGPPGKPGEKTGEVCQFFSKAGWCKYGDQCRHEHIPGLTAGKPPLDPTEPCKFFAKAGWCQFGDSCRYQHIPGEEFGDGQGLGPLPDGPQGLSLEPGLQATGESCQFFAKAGWCKYGAACRFAHVLPPDTQLQPAAKSGEVCQFFSKSGWCKYGDQCKHEHLGGPPAPPDQLGGGGETCKFFAKAGWCQFGDSCRYQHIPGPAMGCGGCGPTGPGSPGPGSYGPGPFHGFAPKGLQNFSQQPVRALSAAEQEAAAAELINSPGMQRAESIGLQLSDEAVKALLTIPSSHASELLETVSEKHTTLRDPSNYVVSTIAKGYVPKLAL